jgi:hypothetical protein
MRDNLLELPICFLLCLVDYFPMYKGMTKIGSEIYHIYLDRIQIDFLLFLKNIFSVTVRLV